MFVSIIPEPITFLQRVLSPAFTTVFLSSFTELAWASFSSFFYKWIVFNDSDIEFTKEFATESYFEGFTKVEMVNKDQVFQTVPS